MSQQMAVEWLKDMLEWNYGDPQILEISWEDLDDLIERAKQMENDRKESAYKLGYSHGVGDSRLTNMIINKTV